MHKYRRYYYIRSVLFNEVKMMKSREKMKQRVDTRKSLLAILSAYSLNKKKGFLKSYNKLIELIFISI